MQSVELFTAEGGDHGFLRTEQWYPRCVEHMEHFLDEHFRRKDLK